jgi:hypothetical protein
MNDKDTKIKQYYQNLLLYLGQLELKIRQTESVLNELLQTKSDTLSELNTLEEMIDNIDISPMDSSESNISEN